MVLFVRNAIFMLVRLSKLVMYVVSFPMQVNVVHFFFFFVCILSLFLWFGLVWFMWFYWKLLVQNVVDSVLFLYVFCRLQVVCVQSVIQEPDCCVFVLWWVFRCVWDYGISKYELPVNCCLPTREGFVDTYASKLTGRPIFRLLSFLPPSVCV